MMVPPITETVKYIFLSFALVKNLKSGESSIADRCGITVYVFFFFYRGIMGALLCVKMVISKLLLASVSMAEAVLEPTSLGSSLMCPSTHSGFTRSSDITHTLRLLRNWNKTNQYLGTKSKLEPLLFNSSGALRTWSFCDLDTCGVSSWRWKSEEALTGRCWM